jgi:hypothetical protein
VPNTRYFIKEHLVSTLSGYTTTYDFWATRFTQLNLDEISLHLTVDAIVAGFIQRPDPKVKLPHNRAIKEQHADDFASYLIRGAEDSTGKWPVIVPALSLFTSPLAVDFETKPEIEAGGVEFGIVRIEKTTPVRIWDGQHRTLGAFLAADRLTKAMTDLHTKAARCRSNGEEGEAAEAEAEIARIKEVRRRLGLIVIPATITLETDEDRISELFTDVADNAKGINATALARLDHRNVFNRVAEAIYDGVDEWTLLQGLIDDDNAYVTQRNPNWTTYRDVAAVAQTCWLGYGARWTENKEQTELADREKEILDTTREFYEGLVSAFPEIDDVLAGTIEPLELRQGGSKTSLLSSSTTIRALASAWHDLRTGHRWTRTGTRVSDLGLAAEPMTAEQSTIALGSLPPMDSGSAKVLDRYWRDHGVMIEPPYVAPTARAGNVRSMAMAIVDHIDGEGPVR